MKFEIKHRVNGSVLFSLETESIKLCVQAAVNGGADLRGADLRGAHLGDAYLGGAYLGGADLRGVKDAFSIGSPGGWTGHGWLRDGYLSIRIGCREFRHHEAVAHWQNRPDRIEQLIATEYARQMALARGWAIEAQLKAAA